MKSSVGAGGRNVKADVQYVQFLLSDVLAQGNGKGLAIDGIVGPKTQAAINKFQQTTMGFADGRVDPDGPTIKRLQALHFNALVVGIRNIGYLTNLARTLERSPVQLDDAKLFARYLEALQESFES